MGETVLSRLLEDLKREGWSDEAASVETSMRARWEIWTKEDYP